VVLQHCGGGAFDSHLCRLFKSMEKPLATEREAGSLKARPWIARWLFTVPGPDWNVEFRSVIEHCAAHYITGLGCSPHRLQPKLDRPQAENRTAYNSSRWNHPNARRRMQAPHNCAGRRKAACALSQL